MKVEKNKILNNNYKDIVEDIINNEGFNKLDDIKHHGGSRLDHVKKVSYYSYKISKKFNMDSRAVARAGLLHDYFTEPNKGFKKRTLSFFKHPKEALKTSEKEFDLSKKESNIIKSHMFPLSIYVPRYKESILVSIVDKVVAVRDFIRCIGWKIIKKKAYTAVLIALCFKI